MEHKIILKCRTCLEDNDEDSMFELFMENDPGASMQIQKLRLSKKIEYCCGVRIRESSDMPSKICWKCFEITRMWYNFRQMCLNSQLYLESLCEDRMRPDTSDDAEFLEYLMEELQVHREKVYEPADAVSTDSDDDDDDDDDLGLLVDEEDDGVYVETENDLVDRCIKEEPQISEQRSSLPLSCDASNKSTRKSIGGSVDNRVKKENSTNSPKKNHLKESPKYRPPSLTSHMCYICGNVYNKKATFAYHMSLHSNVKPHECELCGKTFRQICELKNHMRRHTGEKPYKCSYCDRHFIDRSEKHRHERVHTNTRPYVCSICGKSFMYSAILKNHTKLHTGKKDFNCMVCQKAFTLQHQLKAHLQTITHKQKEAHYVSAGYEVIYE